MYTAGVHGFRCQFCYIFVSVRLEWQHLLCSNMTIPHAGRFDCHKYMAQNKNTILQTDIVRLCEGRRA